MIQKYNTKYICVRFTKDDFNDMEKIIKTLKDFHKVMNLFQILKNICINTNMRMIILNFLK